VYNTRLDTRVVRTPSSTHEQKHHDDNRHARRAHNRHTSANSRHTHTYTRHRGANTVFGSQRNNTHPYHQRHGDMRVDRCNRISALNTSDKHMPYISLNGSNEQQQALAGIKSGLDVTCRALFNGWCTSKGAGGPMIWRPRPSAVVDRSTKHVSHSR